MRGEGGAEARSKKERDEGALDFWDPARFFFFFRLALFRNFCVAPFGTKRLGARALISPRDTLA
jgi:hypothetical protein